MKRSEVKWMLTALTVLLLLTPVGRADGKKKFSAGDKANPVATESGVDIVKSSPAAVDQQLVKDLVEILDSTESPTTFALTVFALEQLGDKAKATVPVIILNAERLKIFSSASAVPIPNTIPSKKQQMATAVAQSIVNLLNGNRTSALVAPPVTAGSPAYRIPTPIPLPGSSSY